MAETDFLKGPFPWYEDLPRPTVLTFSPFSKRAFWGSYPFSRLLPRIVEMRGRADLHRLALEVTTTRILVLATDSPLDHLPTVEAIGEAAERVAIKFLITPSPFPSKRFITVSYPPEKGLGRALGEFLALIVKLEYPGLICSGFGEYFWASNTGREMKLISWPRRWGKRLPDTARECVAWLKAKGLGGIASGVVLFYGDGTTTIKEIVEVRDLFLSMVGEGDFFYDYQLLDTPYALLGLLSGGPPRCSKS